MCCGECRDATDDRGSYDDGYDAGYATGKRDVPELLEWTFKNRHELTEVEVTLLERVSDLMKRGLRA